MQNVTDNAHISIKRISVDRCESSTDARGEKIAAAIASGKYVKLPIAFTKQEYAVGDSVEVTKDNLVAVNRGFDLEARGAKVAEIIKLFGAKITANTPDGGTEESIA